MPQQPHPRICRRHSSSSKTSSRSRSTSSWFSLRCQDEVAIPNTPACAIFSASSGHPTRSASSSETPFYEGTLLIALRETSGFIVCSDCARFYCVFLQKRSFRLLCSQVFSSMHASEIQENSENQCPTAAGHNSVVIALERCARAASAVLHRHNASGYLLTRRLWPYGRIP